MVTTKMKVILCFQVVLILIRIVLDAIANETSFRERKNIFFMKESFLFSVHYYYFFFNLIYICILLFLMFFVMLGIDV